jgi:hypothetical protein
MPVLRTFFGGPRSGAYTPAELSDLPSLIPRQLPASPMLVFPVGVEHALDETV